MSREWIEKGSPNKFSSTRLGAEDLVGRLAKRWLETVTDRSVWHILEDEDDDEIIRRCGSVHRQI
jgi:hypothetical protein